MKNQPLVAVVMGSHSDWDTMQHCCQQLKSLGISYHTQIISAHRTPDLLFEFSSNAKQAGYEVIIAAAGGAAHLPGMIASKTLLPVFGVPIQSHALNGMDSLLSIVQMPAGIPVGTLAIGKAGGVNAALLTAAVLSNTYPEIEISWKAYREQQTNHVLNDLNPEK